MTNKERKKEITKQPIPTKEECLAFYKELTKLADARFVPYYKMAIEALDQEPCEDAISRQAVNNLQKYRYNCGDNSITCISLKSVNDLPPVKPQEPRKGHWIETAEEYYKAVNEKGGGVDENTPYFTDDIACSECLTKFSVIDNEAERFIYCPNCGAKMESEENNDLR